MNRFKYVSMTLLGVILGALLCVPLIADQGSIAYLRANNHRFSNGDYGLKVFVSAADGSLASFGGGVEYTEGDTDTTLTGKVMLFESNTGTSAVSAVSASAPLPITATNLDVQSGGSDLVTSSNFTTVFGTASLILATQADNQALTIDGLVVSAVNYCYDGTNLDLCRASGATEVTEDLAETADAVGGYLFSVRRDTMASSAGTSGDNATFNTDANGLLWTRNADPCSGVAKTHIPISISSATTTEITPSLAGASNHYHICSINLVTDAANDVLVADDDSDNCGSPTAGIFGSDASPAASEGWNFGASGGIALGDGEGAIGKTNGTNRVVCIITSAATQLSGSISVVAAP